MSVSWRDTALADLELIIGHIGGENPFAARRFARELLLAGDSLVLFPRRGRPGREAGTRELVAIRPYIIVYETDDAGDVSILRIWHGAQDRR